MIPNLLDDRWRVDWSFEVELPVSRQVAWSILSDVNRFARLDAFHRRVDIAATEPSAGVDLTLWHGLPGWAFRRTGRILRWIPGSGWAFSDLSRRGNRVGFPHVFCFEVLGDGPSSCRARARVRGLWTTRSIPKWLVELWLRWNVTKIGLTFRNRLLRDLGRLLKISQK